MRAAGVRVFGGQVELLDFPDPRDPGPDEVVIEVAAAGVGNWDDIVRTGLWNVGPTPPMALGVEVAGMVIAVGSQVTGLRQGDEVLGHPLPLRDQGCWAERVEVVDYHDSGWPDRVRELTGDAGVDADVHVGPGGGSDNIPAFR